MRIDTSHARLPLNQAVHAQLLNARDVRLTALEGVTWITVDGELRDVFIGPGESFVVPNDAKVVAIALHGPALIAVDGHAGAVRCVRAERAHGAHWLSRGLRRLRIGSR